MLDLARQLCLNSLSQTTALAGEVANFLALGDAILLSGDLGTGKSTFCRALLQNILLEPDDIPSPTYTIVQTYETTRGTVWHADLYRLSDPSEIVEIGLDHALQDAICLVEWPEVLGSRWPEQALELSFSHTEEPEARLVSVSTKNPKWRKLFEVVHDDR